MIHSALFDPSAILLLLGATLLAALLRSGWSNCALALRMLFSSRAAQFSAAKAKASLAAYVQEIRTRGLLSAEPRITGDKDIDDTAATLAKERSIDAAIAKFEIRRTERLAEGERAQDVFWHAAELASVMGLAGTLLALSSLSTGAESTHFAVAIGTAVATTLYGLLLGNLVFMPLAGITARKVERTDQERQQVIAWLTSQAERSIRQSRTHRSELEAPPHPEKSSAYTSITSVRRAA